ncbi:MAG: hypothetical protein ACI849_001556 [Patiriisocius sp.]|jgi:hypothetical protein
MLTFQIKQKNPKGKTFGIFLFYYWKAYITIATNVS